MLDKRIKFDERYDSEEYGTTTLYFIAPKEMLKKFIPTNDYPEHTIINELQKGYKMGDKVLRAALVNVATEAQTENKIREKGIMTDENGEQYTITTNGKPVYDKTLKLPGDFFVKGEYVLRDKNFEYEKFSEETSELHFDVLEPSQFRVFLLNKF